jgi:hypothetical protein
MHAFIVVTKDSTPPIQHRVTHVVIADDIGAACALALNSRKKNYANVGSVSVTIAEEIAGDLVLPPEPAKTKRTGGGK